MDPLGTQLFDALAACLDGFITAWEDQGEPPPLAEYLPKRNVKVLPYALLELIKVDLEYRWARGYGQSLDAYVAAYPSLGEPEGPPADLIFEAYTHRKRAGEITRPDEYLTRYPGRAEELGRLFDLGSPGTTTSIAGQMPKSVPDPGEVIDDFLLIDRLGRGAFATVFLARQRSMQRTVALKVSANRGEEGETLAQLDHPNIVRVFDQRSLPERDLRLLYMEYVPAGGLDNVVDRIRDTAPGERSGALLLEVVDQALRSRGETPPEDSMLRQQLALASWPETVCVLGAQLANALAYAHDRGVLHRDVKPANVLLARTGAAKLVDFNISYSSKLDGSSAAANLGGSMAYMSAQQLEACSPLHSLEPDALDGRADVFSLGVLLFELLTGERPFEEDEHLQGGWSQAVQGMIDARRAGIVPTRRALVPDELPRLLMPTLERCLGAEPEDRFQSADALAGRLALCLQPRAAELVDPPAGGFARWLRRHGFAAMVIGSLIPNVVLTVLNIRYNLFAVFNDKAYAGFEDMVMGVNAVVYTIGLALAVAWMRPVARAARALEAGVQPDGPARARSRNQMLALPGRIMAIVLPLWVLGGVAFPVWLHLQGAADFDTWFNFTVSNVLFGILAATGCYFMLMRLVLCAFLGPFLDLGAGAPDDHRRLGLVASRAAVWFGFLTAVPFLSLILLALTDPGGQSVFLVLGLIGSVGFGLGYLCMLLIRRDVTALAEATTPRT